MNIERVEALKEFIATGRIPKDAIRRPRKGDKFHMKWFKCALGRALDMEFDDESVMALITDKGTDPSFCMCKTVHCIGGWAEFLWMKETDYSQRWPGMLALNLTTEQADELFYPNEESELWRGTKLYSVSRKEAAAVIGRFLEREMAGREAVLGG